MRRVVLLMAALGLVGLLGSAASAGNQGAGDNKEQAQKTQRSDRDKILGTWVVVAMEAAGKKLPEETIKEKTMVITAEKMLAKQVGRPDEEFHYKLDVMKNPRAIDLKDKNKTMPGIYAFEGDDTLKICLSQDNDRPSEFITKESSKNVLVTLRRAKK